MNFVEGIFYMIWRGLAIGVIISAPMGPVGILCVQRTLEKGRKTGLLTGIGASISDMIYCLLTGFGLSFIEVFLERNQNVIQLIGSVVLIAFGIYLFKSNPSRKLRTPDEKNVSVHKNILNGFLFTFSNPLIIFLIIGLFARFNFMMPDIKFYHYIIGFLSIGAGALSWWWIVTFFIDKVRAHFNLRSMWLINKIIGIIILIFAFVGIISAAVAMAKAENITHLSLNEKRGFEGFSIPADSADKKLTLTNSSSRNIYSMKAITPAQRVEIDFRLVNLNNEAGKKYKYIDNEGKKIKVINPEWGFCISGREGKRRVVSLQTIDPRHDDLYSATTLRVSVTDPDSKETFFINTGDGKGLDLFAGMNAFLFSFDRGSLILQGGNRSYVHLASAETGLSEIDSIGFMVAPGGKISIDHLNLESSVPEFASQPTRFGNPDVLETYMLHSSDMMEGIWRVFDRSLDEDMLRMGGDYKFALVNAENGYDLIYLDGAQTMEDIWKPGMIKARMRNAGFTDIYNVEWLDATGVPIEQEVRAQFEKPLLTLSFPYHSSSIRLRKESRKSR